MCVFRARRARRARRDPCIPCDALDARAARASGWMSVSSRRCLLITQRSSARILVDGPLSAEAANAVRKASTDARQAALTEDASVDDATRDGLLGWFEPGSPIVDEVPVSDDDNGIIGIAYAAKDD